LDLQELTERYKEKRGTSKAPKLGVFIGEESEHPNVHGLCEKDFEYGAVQYLREDRLLEAIHGKGGGKSKGKGKGSDGGKGKGGGGKGPRDYLAGVATKVNGKCGGVNYIMETLLREGYISPPPLSFSHSVNPRRPLTV
jgi:hypothetical protein